MPLVDIQSIVKHHGGLRPFRLRELSVEAGDAVAWVASLVRGCAVAGTWYFVRSP